MNGIESYEGGKAAATLAIIMAVSKLNSGDIKQDNPILYISTQALMYSR